MQYRVSFWMQIAGNALIYSLEFVAVLVFFLHFETLGGWRAGEIAFLYGVSSVSFGIAHIVVSGFASFSQLILRGDFDRLPTRPLSAFVQVLASDVQLRRLGTVIQGCVAFAVANHVAVRDLSIEEPEIETIIAEIYQDTKSLDGPRH